MNPVSRFVAMALFVVLVSLAAVLALAVWRDSQLATASSRPVPGGAGPSGPTSSPPRPRAQVAAQQLALGLAVAGVALSLVLVLGSAGRGRLTSEPDSRPAGGRTDLAALALLAETSVAQGEELNRERDVRRRAEEDVRLKQQLLTQSLDEKIRLGRDLHDGIIQSLYATGLSLETVRTLVKTNPDDAERSLEQTRRNLNQTLREVRAYLAGLTPESLHRVGLARAMALSLAELRAGREAQFDIQIDDEAAALLSAEQHVEVLQIAREAVSNALRHGAAAMVIVRMHRGDQDVCLLVQDNGRGFDPGRGSRGGFGLGNMQARAARVGATVRVTSQPGAGTRVLVTLPLLPAASA